MSYLINSYNLFSSKVLNALNLNNAFHLKTIFFNNQLIPLYLLKIIQFKRTSLNILLNFLHFYYKTKNLINHRTKIFNIIIKRNHELNYENTFYNNNGFEEVEFGGTNR